MADTKLTNLGSEITTVALTDILYAVDDPAGTPVSSFIEAGNLLALPFAQVYTSGGAGTQTPGTSFAKLTQLATDGLSSSGMTPDATNNKITATNTGIYLVSMQISFSGTGGAECTAAIFWNGVEQTQIEFMRKLGAGGDVGSASAVGFIDVTTGATDIEIYVKCDGASDVFDVKELQLFAVRIAPT